MERDDIQINDDFNTKSPHSFTPDPYDTHLGQVMSFKCDICGFTCMSGTLLQQHEKKHIIRDED